MDDTTRCLLELREHLYEAGLRVESGDEYADYSNPSLLKVSMTNTEALSPRRVFVECRDWFGYPEFVDNVTGRTFGRGDDPAETAALIRGLFDGTRR